MSGNRVDTLSSRPRANSAWSNLSCNSGAQQMDGRGGSGAGTKARTVSPTVDTVTYLPRRFRFIYGNFLRAHGFIREVVDCLYPRI